MLPRKAKRTTTKEKRIVFSKTFDNGEILHHKTSLAKSMQYVVNAFATDIAFEEYIVPPAPVSAVLQPMPVKPAQGPTDKANSEQEKLKQEKNEQAPPVVAEPKKEAITDTQKLDILDSFQKPVKEATAAPAAVEAKAAIGSTPSKQASIDHIDAISFSAKPGEEEDDFVKDMKAIMRGEKIFNNETKSTETRTTKPVASTPSVPNALSQMENKQTIFDQIAESMSYAKAYDLGSIDLEKRFNDFDKMASPGKTVTTAKPNSPSPKQANSLSSEDFLRDLNSIADRKQKEGVSARKFKDEYYYQNPAFASTSSSDYSYMQNPAVLIAGIEVADAIQIGLGAVSVAQAQNSSVSGGFALSYEKAQRLLTPEARAQMPGAQTSKKIYKQELMWIGELKKGFADASIIIEWEGNPYGEIGTPVISRDLDHSTDWTKSSCRINFTRLEKIPEAGTDPRTWPIVYRYEGEFDPAGNGKYEFDGEFQINAFGGLAFRFHRVANRSLIEFAKIGEPEEYVRKGKDSIVPVPEIPAEQINYLKSKLP